MPKRALLVGLLAAAFVILGAACMGLYPVGVFNDDACYILQARQMLQTGDSLTFAPDPFGRLNPYMPGYSIFLMPFVGLFGDNLQALRWTSMATMLGAGIVAALLGRRYLDPTAAILLGGATILNPTALAYGSTVLSDILFTLLTIACLLLGDRLTQSADRPGMAWLFGLMTGFSVLVRLEGLVTAAAALLIFLLLRRWTLLLRSGLGMAAVMAPHFLMEHAAGGTGSWYLLRMQQVYQDPSIILGQLGGFWAGFFPMLGENYLGWPGPGAFIAGVLTILAVVGMVRCWKEVGPSGLPFFLVGYLVFHMVWSLPDVRYYLPFWPVLLLFAARAAPRLPAAAVLAAAMACAAPAIAGAARVSQQIAASGADRWATYRWMREHTTPTAIVSNIYPGRVLLMGGRRCAPPASSFRFCDVLAGACRDRIDYVLIEPEVTAKRDVFGHTLVEEPFRGDLWMDRSTLVRKVYETPWDRLYERRVEPGRFLAAHQHFLRADGMRKLDDLPEAEREARRALAQVSDFPEAETLLARVLVEQKQPGDEAVHLLEGEVARYPVDLDSALLLGRLLADRGRADQARSVLQAAHERAVSLQEPQEADEIARVLSTL